jgi:hypothetical protein
LGIIWEDETDGKSVKDLEKWNWRGEEYFGRTEEIAKVRRTRWRGVEGVRADDENVWRREYWRGVEMWWCLMRGAGKTACALVGNKFRYECPHSMTRAAP